jgi:hypothetical protein
MVDRFTLTRFCFLFAAILFSVAAKGDSAGGERWKPEWRQLNEHQVPDWILDAKLGVQYVGPPLELDDQQMYHWQRSAQRHRLFGSPPPDPHAEAMLGQIHVLGGFPYVWVHQPMTNTDAVLASYKNIGARFVVSMLWGAYPGTEGLLMTQAEIQAARRLGLKVGLHYNLLRREGVPSIGDAGYVEWMHHHLQQSVQESDADFVFLDGCLASSEYFKSAEFLAWYYNWAERRGKQVWVNDDLGLDRFETGNYGDLVDFEGLTVQGVSPKPWIDWDILRNQWTCWVNEFGIHRRTGQKWVWEYKRPEDLLLVFIDIVSKGGVWLVQMDNTKQAWDNMNEIGAWLRVNGEAIYGTRPYGKPEGKLQTLPKGRAPEPSTRWMWQFLECVKVARNDGPLYFTRKGQTLYAIHWGWPGESVKLPGIKPARGAAIRMLGVEQELLWREAGDGLIIQTPKTPPCRHAFAYRIPLGP